jgi:hypothetical protein
MIDCLKNILGYNGCHNPINAKIYLESLPGFGITTVSKIKRKEETEIEFMNRTIQVAIEEINDSLKAELYPYFSVNENLRFIEFGKFLDNSYNSAYVGDRGVKISTTKKDLQKIFVESVLLKFNNSGTTNVKVIDGSLITTFIVTLTANVETELILNYTAITDNVYLLVDNTLFIPSKGEFHKDKKTGCCGGGGYYDIGDSKINLNGWNGTNTDSNIYGIQPKVTMMCVYDDLWCNFVQTTNLKQLYKNAYGIVYANEIIQTNSSDAIVIYGGREKAREQIDLLTWELDRKKKTFVSAIFETMKRMNTDCITCRGRSLGYSL